MAVAAETREKREGVALAVLVAALGYFVDIYDLILFGVVRKPSLAALGVTPEDMLAQGERLLNFQMSGLLVGGILWGILGDKRGRLSVLFGSIILYSLANIANGFVQDLDQYAVLRLLAGIGLAGELGAGITLVSEILHREGRGWGTTIVATVGICGGVLAGLVGGEVHWRTAYFIGGGMGLALLALRVGVRESPMFAAAAKAESGVRRGDLGALFRSAKRLRRYVAVILVGVPIWYAVGILIFFSSELGKEMGMKDIPKPAEALMWCYAGLAVGDLASGGLSQVLRSRRKALAVFLVMTAVAVALYFTVAARSLTTFYVVCTFLGLATGYWAVFITTAAEQFGTNLRATVTTTAPNFVRGAVVPMTLGYKELRGSVGILEGAVIVGVIAIALGAVALWLLDETYGKDLDFLEADADRGVSSGA
ncbi:MAG TPA: MFS transporter [Kofleriaceae bacterium]|nr:MFS transporter [Kofleriaceae bacterium]